MDVATGRLDAEGDELLEQRHRLPLAVVDRVVAVVERACAGQPGLPTPTAVTSMPVPVMLKPYLAPLNLKWMFLPL